MATLTWNDSEWPANLIVVEGKVDQQSVDQLIEIFIKQGARGQFVNILDLTKVEGFDSQLRKYYVDQLAAKGHLWDANFLGSATVIASVAMRGALTAINWMQGQLNRLSFVGSRREGEKWNKELLAKAGIRWPGFKDRTLIDGAR